MIENLIIGAGPAGLAVAASLRARGIAATILERADAVGSSWRRHYERSRALRAPGPRVRGRHARHHALDIRFGERVTHGCRRVVMATGYPRVPVIPAWPGRALFGGPMLHSSEYTTGARFRGQRLLVIGFDNSGGEIAIDLHEHGARPAIAVRSAVDIIPRDVLGVPVLSIGIATAWLPPRVADALSAPIVRAAVGDIRALGFRKLPYGPMVQIKEHGRIPLLDIGTLALIRANAIAVFPDVRALWERGVELADGRREEVDAIVTANGCPTRSGAEIAPDLYVCGLLREIWIEAERVASAIHA